MKTKWEPEQVLGCTRKGMAVPVMEASSQWPISMCNWGSCRWRKVAGAVGARVGETVTEEPKPEVMNNVICKGFYER